jgi:hypothetical protein
MPDPLAAALAKLGRTPAPPGSLRALAEAQPRDEPPKAPEEDSPAAERWARIREQAARLAPGYLGYVRWVDRCRVDSGTGLHAMDPAWDRHFGDFYETGLLEDVGRYGVRAAKSDSCSTAVTGETLLVERRLAGSIIGVCPVLSANMREAGDRFDTITANLRACGFRDLTGTRGEPAPFEFKTSGGGSSPRVIDLLDSQGHTVAFRVLPASEAGAAGFTGIAGFGDELDLWRVAGANPAEKVVRVLRSRYLTQPEARLHLMSATYDRESYHSQMIADAEKARADGRAPTRYVARLGAEGSRKDHEARLRLAKLHGLSDPLLLAPPLPADCPDIPSWVTNPVAPIERAYELAEGNLRVMFGLYGGRVGGAMGETVGRVTALPGRYAGTDPRAGSRSGKLRP